MAQWRGISGRGLRRGGALAAVPVAEVLEPEGRCRIRGREPLAELPDFSLGR